MADSEQIMGALDNRVRRRDERRDFFKAALGVAAAGAGGFLFANQAAAQTAITEPDVLNFALQLEYLEAQFYLFAVNGAGLPANQQTGTGTQGPVQITQGAAGQPRQVAFQDRLIAEYAREIAADEAQHVAFLRTNLAAAAVAQPTINLSGGANGPFTAAARAAGLISNTATFDPYANDDNFLLSAFIFEDVGVTAYKGAASALANNRTFLQAAAGILAVEAYHAATIRTVLYNRGAQSGSTIYDQVMRISDARDSLDGTGDRDQGIAPVSTSVQTATGQQNVLVSNIVPTDTDALTFSRTPQQVLNIVYLTPGAVTMGGFFPAGLNGAIRAAT